MSKMKLINEDLSEADLLKQLSDTELIFGKYLRAIRKAKGISIRALSDKVNKTPTYISDIENRNNKPPEKELLDNIILHLNLESYTDTIKNNLYDLAAKERNDVPADIKEYIMKNKDLLQIIRTEKNKPDDQQIWSQLLERV